MSKHGIAESGRRKMRRPPITLKQLFFSVNFLIASRRYIAVTLEDPYKCIRRLVADKL